MKKNIILFLGIVAVIALLLIWGKSNEQVDETLKLVGKPAPEFSLSDRNGKTYTVQSLKGKNVVLFFSEGLICYPACWDEMVALAKDNRFQENNTVALSVVVDPKEAWQKATSEIADLKQVTILFDTDKRVSEEYGMLRAKSSMHNGSAPGHTYVILDKNSIVRFVYDDIKMGKNGDKLIEQIRKLDN